MEVELVAVAARIVGGDGGTAGDQFITVITLLHHYIITSLHLYIITSLHHYIIRSIHHYIITSIRVHPSSIRIEGTL